MKRLSLATQSLNLEIGADLSEKESERQDGRQGMTDGHFDYTPCKLRPRNEFGADRRYKGTGQMRFFDLHFESFYDTIAAL